MARSETFATQVVDNAMANAENQQIPMWADLMSEIPPLTATMGYQLRRGGNTILKGGFRDTQRGFIRRGVGQTRSRLGFGAGRGASHAVNRGWGRGWWENWNPGNFRTFGRFSSEEVFRPGGKYTPFAFSAAGNWVGRVAAADESTRIGSWLGRRGFSGLGTGEALFGQGALSRISAVSRIGSMSDARFAARYAGGGSSMMGGATSRQAAQHNILAGTTGRASQYAAGMASVFTEGGLGSRFDRKLMFSPDVSARGVQNIQRGRQWALGAGREIGLEVGEGAAQWSTRRIAGGGVKTAGRALAAGNIGKAGTAAAKMTGLLGGKAVMFLGGPIGIAAATAWTVYDVARLTTKAAGYAARTAAAGVRSFQGGLNTGIMDQNFQNTTAGMTSRARGVQAIQNSRLNARSVLGSEAGYMASHFG